MSKTEWTQFDSALLDASLEEFADIPAEDAIDLTLSEEFELEGLELVEKARRGKVPRFGKTLRRALLIAAIIVALATTALAIPPVRHAIREGLIRFFTRNAGTHYDVYFDQEQAATAPDYIEKVYRVGYIPEGYTEDVSYVHFGAVSYSWCAEDNLCITFFYAPIPDDYTGPAVDAEESAVSVLNLNGYQVFSALFSDGSLSYVWTDNEYYYMLIGNPNVSADEMNKIFTSIQIDLEAEIPTHN
jgi:hypothetical protein